MFDKLVESTHQKTKGRNTFYLVTSLIYGAALSAIAILTIIWFNPGMAEANTARLLLMPPPVPTAPPPAELLSARTTTVEQFVPPVTPPKRIPNPYEVPPAPQVNRKAQIVPGAEAFRDSSGIEVPNSIGQGEGKDAPPPPPPPTLAPTPKITPTPVPAPEGPKTVTVSTGVLQGKAIRKVQPPYPTMGKAVRAAGAVPVQITISEEGRVIAATVISGHPLLRDAAQQAAMQWVFSPTVLNGKSVKVSGVISFNFILN